MLGHIRMLALVVCALAPAAAAVRISGRVTNENNAPVAGAQVTLESTGASATAGTKWQAITPPNGAFSFSVPSGDYLISAQGKGYFALEGRKLTLENDTDDLHLLLSPLTEVFESVEVSAAPNAINLDNTASEQTLTGTQILNIPYPTSNDLKNALPALPGIVRDVRGNLHLNGGSSDQVFYTLDGFNVADPLTGRFESRLGVESVQAVQVSSGRQPAEFGKGSAGAIAIYTRSGGDRLRYSATNFVPGIENRKGLTIGDWTPRLSVSGPIRRGRAWFSDSFDTQYSKLVVEELPKGEDRTSSWRFSNLFNTQINLTPSNILYAGLLSNHWTAPRTGLSPLDPRETTVDRRSRQWFFHVRDQIYLAGGALLEIGYARNRTFGREIPQGSELYLLTPIGKRGNSFVDAVRKAGRDQWIASFLPRPISAAGSHQLKVGLDVDRVDYWQDVRRTGYEHFSEDGAPLRRVVFAGNGQLQRRNFEAASFVQDSWRPESNVLIELGLRTDWDQIVRNWNLSPRAGAAWSPWEHTRISAGWGFVYDATSLRLFTRPLDQYSLTTYFDPDGLITRGPAVSVFRYENRGLASPRYHTWTFGIERQLPARIHARLEFQRKTGRRGFTYYNTVAPDRPPTPERVAEFNTSVFDGVFDLTNQRRDRFYALEFTVRQTFSRQYEWMASYVRSRAVSNAVVDFNIDEPTVVTNNAGPMPWDAPNRLLSWGYLPTHRKNWAIAYLLEARDGLPFSVQSQDGQLDGLLNARRFPMYFNLNLHLERRFVMRGQRWALRGGFNNITSHENPTVVNNVVGHSAYLQYYGGQGRSLNFRIRWLGRS